MYYPTNKEIKKTKITRWYSWIIIVINSLIFCISFYVFELYEDERIFHSFHSYYLFYRILKFKSYPAYSFSDKELRFSLFVFSKVNFTSFKSISYSHDINAVQSLPLTLRDFHVRTYIFCSIIFLVFFK